MDEVERAHEQTQAVIDRLRPHVVHLAVTVEALERAIAEEQQAIDEGVDGER